MLKKSKNRYVWEILIIKIFKVVLVHVMEVLSKKLEPNMKNMKDMDKKVIFFF
jgi:hypothetical protein